MAIPIEFLLHMAEGDDKSGLDVDDALPEQDAFSQFVERAETSFNRADIGADVFQKAGAPAYRPPVGNELANPWLVDHPRILSKQIESEWEAPIIEDDHIQKRIGDTTRRANLKAFIKRRMAEGATVEELAEFAEKHDPAHAQLIREIGGTL